MKTAFALGVTATMILAAAGSARAIDCNAVIAMLNQGFSEGEVADAGNVPVSAVDACWRRRAGTGFNPAGPPPLNAAGPPPVNAAGPGPRNAAGPPPLNAAGPGPRNAAGPPPLNPAGIPK